MFTYMKIDMTNFRYTSFVNLFLMLRAFTQHIYIYVEMFYSLTMKVALFILIIYNY